MSESEYRVYYPPSSYSDDYDYSNHREHRISLRDRTGAYLEAHKHNEIKRSKSYRMADCSAERTRRELERRRPATLHLKRTHQVPKFQYSVDQPSCADELLLEPLRKPSSTPNVSPNVMRVQQMDIPPGSNTRSLSPRPCRLAERRDSMQTMHRICKSDEVNRRPSMTKMQTLDIPNPSRKTMRSLPDLPVIEFSRSDSLQRQMSLSECATTPEAPNPRHISLLQLTSKQKRSLKISFASLNNGGTFLRIVEQVFRRMESKFPDIRSIFLTTAFVNSLSRERESPPLVKTEHDHCKCLVGMFERIIDNLDEMDKEVALLRLYGEKHAQMRDSGFNGLMIETFGELAIGVIGSQECVKFNHDCVKAWRLLLANITDEMKVGFDRSMKLIDRRNSHNEHHIHQECPYQR